MNTEFLYFKGSKKIAYGCSQLMNAKEFVEQVGNIIVIAIMVLYQGVICYKEPVTFAKVPKLAKLLRKLK